MKPVANYDQVGPILPCELSYSSSIINIHLNLLFALLLLDPLGV